MQGHILYIRICLHLCFFIYLNFKLTTALLEKYKQIIMFNDFKNFKYLLGNKIAVMPLLDQGSWRVLIRDGVSCFNEKLPNPWITKAMNQAKETKLSIKVKKLLKIYILPDSCFAFAKEYLSIIQIFRTFCTDNFKFRKKNHKQTCQ